jgi:glc operon protein GlcG
VRTTRTLDYSEAQKIVDAVVGKALRRQQVIVVVVADPYGEPIALARMDGAPIPSIRIATNKAWTAARARTPTREIGEQSRHPEQGYDIAYYGDARFVGWGGGIPVFKDGEVVGSVAVSGLSADEDAELATLGAAAVG